MAEEGQGVAEAGSEEQTEETPVESLKKIIDVRTTDAGVLRKSLTVSVPADRIREERDKQYSDLINDALVPGFRKGHAPRRLVEKRFGSEVGEQVLTKLLSNAYLAAVEKESLQVLGDPVFRLPGEKKADAKEEPADRVVDFNTAMDTIQLPDEGPLTFTCEVEIKPTFELPELENFPIEKPTVKITDDDVSKQVLRQQANRGTYVPVPGPVQADDLVVADLKLSCDGKVLKEHENVNLAARPQRIEGAVLEKLGDVLGGAKPGDTRTMTATMPEDAAIEEARGKEVTFEFKVQDIKRLNVPPIDAEWLSSQGFDTEQEYRDFIKSRMEMELDQAIRGGMRGQVTRHLLNTVKLDLPEGLSSRQVERSVIRRMVDLRRRGVPMSEIEKHADELRTSARTEAIDQLKLHFILEKIAEKLEVDVTEEEINSQIAMIARQYGRRFDRVRDELAREQGLENLYLQIRDEKCIDHMLDKAKITESTGPASSVSELADAT